MHGKVGLTYSIVIEYGNISHRKVTYGNITHRKVTYGNITYRACAHAVILRADKDESLTLVKPISRYSAKKCKNANHEKVGLLSSMKKVLQTTINLQTTVHSQTQRN